MQNSATAITGGPRRPLVILLGWLGARPHNLRRYEKLYTDMGFCVWIRVASPAMVVESLMSAVAATAPKKSSSSSLLPPVEVMVPPRTWPHRLGGSGSGSSSGTTGGAEQLAWEILAEVETCWEYFPLIFFHVFSNGGCVIWEKISLIFLQQQQQQQQQQHQHQHQQQQQTAGGGDGDGTTGEGGVTMEEDSLLLFRPVVQRRLEGLRARMAGIVLDSCPGSDLQQLPNALNYCTLYERMQVLLSTNYLLLGFVPSVQAAMKQRETEYMNNLTTHNDDNLSIPQLYLYSENDTLAPYQSIDALVMAKQQRQQQWNDSSNHHNHNKKNQIIWQKKWIQSAHCLHYYHHPIEYKQTVCSFTKFCMMHSLQKQQQQQKTNHTHPPRSRL